MRFLRRGGYGPVVLGHVLQHNVVQVDIIAGKLGAVTHRSVIVPHRSVGKIALQRGAYLLNEGADTLLQAVLGKLRLGNFQIRQRLNFVISKRSLSIGLTLFSFPVTTTKVNKRFKISFH